MTGFCLVSEKIVCECWWSYKVVVVNGNFFFSDNVDASDLKQFFETNYSQIYFIFYENFITLENSLKLKGKNFYKKNFFLIYKVLFFFFFFFNKNTGSSWRLGVSRATSYMSLSFLSFQTLSRAVNSQRLRLSLELSLVQALTEQQQPRGKWKDKKSTEGDFPGCPIG